MQKQQTKCRSRRQAKNKAQRRARKNIISRISLIKAKWSEMLRMLPDKEKNGATVEYLNDRILECNEAMWPSKEWKPGEFTRAFIALQDGQNAFVHQAIEARQKQDLPFY